MLTDSHYTETLDLSFNYDIESISSLFRLWKLTNDPQDLSSNKISSLERLNNRSWRLINKKLLQRNSSSSTSSSSTSSPVSALSSSSASSNIQDLSKDSLSNFKPKDSQFLLSHTTSSNSQISNFSNNSQRPSLFLYPSKTGSQVSRLSLNTLNRRSTGGTSIRTNSTNGNLIGNLKFNINSRSSSIQNSRSNSILNSRSNSIQTKLIKQLIIESTNSSDTSDISEVDEDEDFSDSEEEIAPNNQPRPSASDLSYGVPLPQSLKSSNHGSHHSSSSRTSFVRGFSPSPQPPRVNVEPPVNSNSQTSQHSSNSSKSQNIFANNKNIFYIANSPSPPPDSANDSGSKTLAVTNNDTYASPKSKNNSSENLLRLRNSSNASPRSKNNSCDDLLRIKNSNHASPKSKNNSSENLHQYGASHSKRQGSLFSNYQIKAVSHHTDQIVLNKDPNNEDDDDNSSTDISDGSFLSESEEEEVATKQQSNPTARSLRLSDQSFIKSRRSTMSKSEDNESEWMSVSSESEISSPKVAIQPLKFDKKIPLSIPTRSVVSNSTDTFQNTTIYEENDEDLIESSSLKNKQFTKPTSLLSGLFLNELANLKAGFNSQNHASNLKKPLLKRSSTTGIITVDQDFSASGRDKNKIKRPSILFSKKYTSLTDISKNYPHYHQSLLKNHNITPDNLVKRPSPTVAGPPASDDDSEDDSLFAKQKSIVSISDFNVTTKPSSIHSGDINNHENGDKKLESSTVSNDSSLSSSLNKYSTSLNNHSFSKILSKSSLSLSNLFNQSKNRISSTSNNIKNKSYLYPQKIPGENHTMSKSYDNSSLRPNRPVERSPISRSFNKSSLNESIQEESIKEEKNAEGANTLLAKPIGSSPNSSKTPISMEFSNSLKESINIDNKLGKVPKATITINDEELLRHHRSKLGLTSKIDFGEEDDVDDYHSKGW